MNTPQVRFRFRTFSVWLAGLSVCWGFVSGIHAATPVPLLQPTILTNRVVGTNVLISVKVPKGWGAVVLESRTNAVAGAWVPRAIARSAGKVVFRVPAFLLQQGLRARGQLQEPLPRSFYRGRKSFANRKSSLWRPDQGRGEVFTLSASGNLAANAAVPATVSATRAVVESDIWKLAGDTLYFFNQLRGLQVIDVSNPDAPVLRGSLALPAVGEQMYLLDGGHVVLLARNSCGGDWQSQLIVVDVAGAPRIVAALPVNGWLQESRLVGSALYVAAQGYRAGATADDWQWGTEVDSFDLSNPAAPVARSSLWYGGQVNAVLATDRWLFVANVDYNGSSQTVVRVLDLSSADGTLRDLAGVAPAGDVADKFKMNLSGDVLTVISQSFQPDNGPFSAGAWLTTLETFSLANPSAPVRLASLELTRGDSLFATRFESNHAYVVTFQQVDPLWVVDLSNPAKPAIAGKVAVPGWSTYIQPMGDRLLTVGVESNRVAVSLFDVHDPTQPALLSRVPLGQNYSWSEANDDEKALTVLPELGLVLLPYEGTTTNGWAARVQLLDLATNALTARGVIEHQFSPRRATAHRGRVLSISNEDLLGADVTDRDHPVVTADTLLAWPVNQLFVQGNYLLEIANGGGWSGAEQPVVRVAPLLTPNVVAGEIGLTNFPVVGATMRDGRLFLLQSPPAPYYGGPVVYGGPVALGGALDTGPGSSAGTNLVMTVLDVSVLPAISVLGQALVPPASAAGAGGNYRALWPSTNLLVWFTTGFGFWINPLADSRPVGLVPSMAVTVAAPGVAMGLAVTNVALASPTVAGLRPAASGDQPGPQSGRVTTGAQPALTLSAHAAALNSQSFVAMPYWWPWWNNGGARLLAFDVSSPANPQLTSSMNFNPANGWGFSAAFAAQGLVYFTHEQSDYVWINPRAHRLGADWRVSDSLEVIDFNDPTNPTLRPSISVPGQLAGISDDGVLLYLLGAPSGTALENRAAVNACAYDGVNASLLASLALPQTWPQPVVVSGRDVVLGRAGANAKAKNTIEIWNLSSQGRFVRRASLNVPQPFTALAVFGALVAAQDSSNLITLFDASALPALRQCGQGGPSGCLWFDLNRADGHVESGLWLPLDDYGVTSVLRQ
jgi:hypothetical protein